MKKITTLALAIGATISLAPIARCDEIEFTTLPQPVQTTVIRETHIANPSYVTRVVRSDNGVYAVTVREKTGDQVVYVNPEGAIVQAPSSTTTTTTVQEPSTTTTVQPRVESARCRTKPWVSNISMRSALKDFLSVFKGKSDRLLTFF